VGGRGSGSRPLARPASLPCARAVSRRPPAPRAGGMGRPGGGTPPRMLTVESLPAARTRNAWLICMKRKRRYVTSSSRGSPPPRRPPAVLVRVARVSPPERTAIVGPDSVPHAEGRKGPGGGPPGRSSERGEAPAAGASPAGASWRGPGCRGGPGCLPRGGRQRQDGPAGRPAGATPQRLRGGLTRGGRPATRGIRHPLPREPHLASRPARPRPG
jgi:hypothetical protein